MKQELAWGYWVK